MSRNVEPPYSWTKNIERLVKSHEINRYCKKVDGLGRIVLPIELRRTLGIDVKDALEIFVDGNQIVLNKYEPVLRLLQHANDIVKFRRRKNICRQCMKELTEE